MNVLYHSLYLTVYLKHFIILLNFLWKVSRYKGVLETSSPACSCMKKGKIPILCELHSWYVRRKGIRSVNPIETVQLDLLEMGAHSLPSLPPTGLCSIYFLFLSLHHRLSTPYIFLVPQSTPVPKLNDFLAHIPTMSLLYLWVQIPERIWLTTAMDSWPWTKSLLLIQQASPDRREDYDQHESPLGVVGKT